MKLKTKSIVSRRGEPRFDMAGKLSGYPLCPTEQTISEGLVDRLSRYAWKRLIEWGFGFVWEWNCEVSTVDDEKVYTVTFINNEGGALGIQGIYTNHGWPFLDHGLFIDTRSSE